MDDLLSGADDVETLIQIRKEVIHILNACGFNLAKWYSNCKDLNGEKLVRQLEIQSECNKIKSRLIVAKSKVAPAKEVKTLPRLELADD